MKTHTRRQSGRPWWATILAGAAVWTCTGCDSEAAKAFRAASSAEFKQGVGSIVDGLVDGVFELWEPDATSSSDSNGDGG